MPRRKAALQALELLRNVDDTQSVASDDDNDYEDNDDFDNDFEDEMETTNQPNAEYDSDENSDNEENEGEEETEETNIDKTSKNGMIWIRLKDGEETSLRKKINYNILNLVGINSWILYKTCNISKISRRMYLKSLADQLLEMVNKSVQPTTPITPVASIKRFASTEIDSSAKKKCQIRLCNGNKSNFNCDKCKQFTCGPCLGEKVFKSICKNYSIKD